MRSKLTLSIATLVLAALATIVFTFINQFGIAVGPNPNPDIPLQQPCKPVNAISLAAAFPSSTPNHIGVPVADPTMPLSGVAVPSATPRSEFTRAPAPSGIDSSIPVVATAPMRIRPTATSFPDKGARLSAISEITVALPPLDIEGLSNPDVDNNNLVASVKLRDGRMSIVVVDLTTGAVRQVIPETRQGIADLRVSSGRISWIEPGQDRSVIHIYDLAQNCQYTLDRGPSFQLDFNAELVVWQELREGDWGIYGYNVESNQTITVTPQFGAFPRVCSNEWVIYLKNVVSSEIGSADLFLHQTQPAQSTKIGQTVYPKTASAGQHHACDGERVVWVSANLGAPAQTHVYDIAQKTDKSLDMPQYGIQPIQIHGDIVLGMVGYDLQRDVVFPISLDLPAEIQKTGAQLRISGGRMVLVPFELFNSTHSVFVRQIERD